jgi:hypothetical protein
MNRLSQRPDRIEAGAGNRVSTRAETRRIIVQQFWGVTRRVASLTPSTHWTFSPIRRDSLLEDGQPGIRCACCARSESRR